METNQVGYSGQFDWSVLGDVGEGRKNLGGEMPVVVYRLFQYTMRDVLSRRYGVEECKQILRDSGFLAGTELASHMLNLELPLNEFLPHLQETLLSLQIGVLRVERYDESTGKMELTVSEDLDCSGLPVVGDAVCNYDEGFIKGILDTYTKKNYLVIETDCWAKGDRVCRFEAEVQ